MPESIWQQEKYFSVIFSPFNVQNMLLYFYPQTSSENFSRHKPAPCQQRMDTWFGATKRFLQLLRWKSAGNQENWQFIKQSNWRKKNHSVWTSEKNTILFCDINIVILGPNAHEFQAFFHKPFVD